jgi:5-bromo-4-chloroindolyl phosphate hydrolysis protein
MGEFLSSSTANLVILIAVLAGLIAVGVYAILKVRGLQAEEATTASGLLTNFRELHHEGDLSDEEYRTIKSVLSEQLQEEIKDSGEKG